MSIAVQYFYIKLLMQNGYIGNAISVSMQHSPRCTISSRFYFKAVSTHNFMKKMNAIHLLRIALPEDGKMDALHWYAFNANQDMEEQGISPFDALPAHQSAQWIIPASCIAGHLLSVPSQTGRHLTSIVTQALEDMLLGDQEDAHAVIAKQASAGQLVWVCSKQWLSMQLSRWNKTYHPPESAFSVYDLLPDSNQTVMAQHGAGFIFRTAAGHVGYFDDISLAHDLLDTHDYQLSDDLYCRPLLDRAVNILSGPFASQSQARLKPAHFRRSAWLAGSLACTLLLGALLNWQQLEYREKQLRHEIRQTFAAAFPGQPIIDPVMQWKSKQRERNGNVVQPDALDQLSRFAQELPGIMPRSAEFQDGVIRLLLTESDLASARARLQQAGQEFTVSPAEPGFARLDIRAKQAPKSAS